MVRHAVTVGPGGHEDSDIVDVVIQVIPFLSEGCYIQGEQDGRERRALRQAQGL